MTIPKGSSICCSPPKDPGSSQVTHLQVEPAHEAVEVEQVLGDLVARPLHLPRDAEQQRESGVHLRRHCLQQGEKRTTLTTE